LLLGCVRRFRSKITYLLADKEGLDEIHAEDLAVQFVFL
jgi:hypothetical protein